MGLCPLGCRRFDSCRWPCNQAVAIHAVRIRGRSHEEKDQLFIAHLKKTFGEMPYWDKKFLEALWAVGSRETFTKSYQKHSKNSCFRITLLRTATLAGMSVQSTYKSGSTMSARLCADTRRLLDRQSDLGFNFLEHDT